MTTTETQRLSLGPTDIQVAALGLGTWAWGDRLYWTYGKDYDAAQLRDTFGAAIAAGITLFDTAEIYGFGESERLLGRFSQSLSQPLGIATKYFPLPWRWHPQAVADALTRSLERLQCKQIALYQVHWPFEFFLGQPALMTALAQEVHQGRIQAVGVSNYSAEQMKQAQGLLAQHGVPLAVNQVQYSLLARQIETNGVLATAQELGVTILAYCPLAQGLLTGKYRAENWRPPMGARRLDPRFSPKGLRRLEPLFQALTAIGKQQGRSPSQVALNWLISQGNVIPIPGAKTAEQAHHNAGALGWHLSPAQVEALNQVSQ